MQVPFYFNLNFKNIKQMSLRTMLKAFKKQVAKLDEDKINKRFNDSIRVVKKA